MIVIRFEPGSSVRLHSYFDSFCTCHERGSNTLQCHCGEEYHIHDWTWDKDHLNNCTLLSTNEHEVLFNGNVFIGTVRGTLPFQPNRHYYWEIKILTGLSGQDMNVGVGTENLRMDMRHFSFLLEGNFWGYSYCGIAAHNYYIRRPGPWFGKGSIIGMHLDTRNGTLEFYNNRRPLGVTYTGLIGPPLYPMVWCRTNQAAMRLTCALSISPSLQLLSMLTLRKNPNVSLASSIDQMPGFRNLLASRFWWLMEAKQTQQHEEKHAIVPSPSSSHETGPSRHRKRKRQRAESSSRESDHDDE